MIGATGVVTALHHVPIGNVWKVDDILNGNGSSSLRFDKTAFAAFELFILKSTDTKNEYSENEIKEAQHYFQTLSEIKKQQLTNNIIAGLPGGMTKSTSSIEKFNSILETYKEIDAVHLQKNLIDFLKEIVPVAEANQVLLAIHPDDPPYSILGLPRVVSTEKDATTIINAVKSSSNGLCFCTGFTEYAQTMI